jgi:hypothetical protein
MIFPAIIFNLFGEFKDEVQLLLMGWMADVH